MKVSIITVVYNNEKTIADAIESVQSQTYKNIEHIIIDGKSSDNTLRIINQHKSPSTRIFSEPDKGIYDAMNKGIKLATGDLVGILNSDDIYSDDEVIFDIVSKLEENPGINMIYGNLVYVETNNVMKIVRKWNSKAYSDNFFENGNVPPHPTLFVKKCIYQTCGLFNIKFRLAADYDFMLRSFKKVGNTSMYFPRLMVRMRLGGATNKNFWNIYNGNKEILDSWRENKFKLPLQLVPLRIFKRLIQYL